VKLSEHVYVIPDFKVGMVPNVGIVVGTKGTLVIDPGLGWRNGEVVLRELQKVSPGGDLYIVNTHFQPEHTTGEVAFPASAKVLRAAAQQQDVDEMGLTWVSNFAARSPEIAALRARAAELKKDGKSADEAGKILVDEFRAKYPGWAQAARVTTGAAAVYRELP
jgi:glyoxylase-like metal-dependent hydrolase (beta-lactamase superfamily II)